MANVVFCGLCGLTIFLPLAFGATENWAILLFEAGLALLFVLWIFGRRPQAPAPAPTNRAGRIFLAILIGVFFLGSILQLIPLPDSVVREVSPRAASLEQSVVESGLAGGQARPARFTLSVAPGLTLFEFLKYLSYGLYGFLAFQSLRTRKQAEVFAYVLLAVGLFEAAYGLAEVFSGREAIFSYRKVSSLGSVTGTFINKNHLAGFLEMIFPLSLGLLLAKADFFSFRGCRTLREKILWFSQERLQQCVVLGLISAVLALGLIFTRSRSGIFILFISVFLMAILLSAAGSGTSLSAAGRLSGSRGGKVLRTVMLAVVAVAVIVGAEPVVNRFTKESLFLPQGRLAFYRDTVRLVRDFPLFGAGLGTYGYAFTAYQQEPAQGIVSHAHSDYLEVLAESGFPAGVALVLAGLAGLGLAWGRWGRRRDPLARGIGLGAMAGLAAVLLHSATDFNLHIPANAATFILLYILALAPMSRPQEQTVPAPKRRPVGRFLWLLPAGLFIFIVGRNFLGYRAYAGYRTVRAEARSIESSFPALEERLSEAVRLTRDPNLSKELGRLYLERALSENSFGTAEKRDFFCDRALESFSAALRGNAADAELYFESGKVFLLYNFPLLTFRDKGIFLFKRALDLDPTDSFLNLHIAYFFLSQWDSLGGPDRQYALSRIRFRGRADPQFAARLRRLWKENYGETQSLEERLRAVDPEF